MNTPAIFIESKPIRFGSFSVFGKEHLYLVFRDSNGSETVIRGGPASNNPLAFGDIVVEVDVPINQSEDARRTNDDPPQFLTPEQRNSRQIDLNGRDATAVWNIIKQHTTNIGNANLNYNAGALAQNSNSVIASVLNSVGINIDNNLPVNKTKDVFPGADNLLEFATNLQGAEANDIIDGYKKNDTLKGEAGSDTLKGEGDNDLLEGGLDNDLLDGGKGSDILKGEAGNDTLKGGQNNDLLEGGSGNDLLDGGDNNSFSGISNFFGGQSGDLAKFSDNFANYDYSTSSDKTIVTFTRKNQGADGIDTLSKIEFAEFADTTQPLPNGQAVQTNSASTPRTIASLPLEDGVAETKIGPTIFSGTNPSDTNQYGRLSLTLPISMLDGNAEYTVNFSAIAPDTQYNIVYIIDVSASMNATELQAAKDSYTNLTNYFINIINSLKKDLSNFLFKCQKLKLAHLL
jgi:hypothetical protein